MAGIKKENKNRNSLIAENRFKKAPIKLLRKKNIKKKKSNRSVSLVPSFLIRLLRKISFLILKVIWSFFLADQLYIIPRYVDSGKLLLFRPKRI